MIDDDDKNMKQQQQEGKSPHTDSDSCNALCITLPTFYEMWNCSSIVGCCLKEYLFTLTNSQLPNATHKPLIKLQINTITTTVLIFNRYSPTFKLY